MCICWAYKVAASLSLAFGLLISKGRNSRKQHTHDGTHTCTHMHTNTHTHTHLRKCSRAHTHTNTHTHFRNRCCGIGTELLEQGLKQVEADSHIEEVCGRVGRGCREGWALMCLCVCVCVNACTEIHCITPQHTATCGSTLPHTATKIHTHVLNAWQHKATHCNKSTNILATNGSTLQHTATKTRTCSPLIALQYTATHCNTLQQTATYGSTLQHAATKTCTCSQRMVTHCTTLQRTAAHCNTLQRKHAYVLHCSHTCTYAVCFGEPWQAALR